MRRWAAHPVLGLLPHLAGQRAAVAWTGIVDLANNAALVFLAVAGSHCVALAVLHRELAAPPWWLAAAVAVVLRAALTWHEMDLSHSVAYRVLAALRMGLFDGFARGVPARRPGLHTGKLAATAMGDVERLEFFYAHTVAQLSSAGVLLLGCSAALLGISPGMAACLVAGVGALVLVTVPWLRGNARLGGLVQAAKADVSATAVDILQGSREIASYGLQGQVRLQLAAASRTVEELERRLRVREAAASTLRELSSLAILVAVFLMAWHQPSLDPAWIPPLIAGTMVALSPLVEAVAMMTQLQAHHASARRVLEGINLPPEEPPNTGICTLDPRGPLGIRVRGASFAYTGAAPALAPLWLTVRPGEHLGIAGKSGAGKSTLARLLMGLWATDCGTIELLTQHGTPVDLHAVDRSDFRSQVTLVEQDTVVFHGSLLENLRLAAPHASEEEVAWALEQAGLPLDGGTWPVGIHTLIGEGGTGLSGGERTRIALARALVLRPRLLLLDETTANLDADAEASVLDAIARLAGTTTVITISHRESTLRRCDRRVDIGDLQKPGGRPVQ